VLRCCYARQRARARLRIAAAKHWLWEGESTRVSRPLALWAPAGATRSIVAVNHQIGFRQKDVAMPAQRVKRLAFARRRGSIYRNVMASLALFAFLVVLCRRGMAGRIWRALLKYRRRYRRRMMGGDRVTEQRSLAGADGAAWAGSPERALLFACRGSSYCYLEYYGRSQRTRTSRGARACGGRKSSIHRWRKLGSGA
jgi:hypothetical protein